MKKLIFILLIISNLIQLSAQSKTAQQWFQEGISSYPNFEEGIKCFTKAIELGYIYLDDAYSSRGSAYYGIKKYQLALNDHTQAIRINPNIAFFYENRGLTLWSLKEYQKAVIDFNKAIEIKPNSPEAYLYRGNIKEQHLSAYRAAILDYDTALSLKPNFPNAYLSRGQAKNFQMGDYVSAIADFDKAIDLKPDFAPAYDGRGATKVHQGKYQEAIPDFDQAIELEPNGWTAYYNRGEAYYNLGDCHQAIADYDKAQSLGKEQFFPDKPYRAAAVAQCEKLDKNPPTLQLFEPKLDSRGTGVEMDGTDSLNVRGRANDASGIRSIWINGNLVPLDKNKKEGNFSTKIVLPKNKELHIKVTDTKGNVLEKKWQISPNQQKVGQVEKRLALVVANADYKGVNPLGECPQNDAEDMAAALRRLHFDVIVCKDVQKGAFEDSVRRFVERLKAYDIGLFFYAGHGFGIETTNYLLPIDFPKQASKADVNAHCVSLKWVQDKMAEAGSVGKSNIVIVDACRDDGGLRNIRGGGLDWVKHPIPTGFITCYAVPHGEPTLNCDGRNGLYTSILLQYLETPKLLLQQIFTRVNREIIAKGGQSPEVLDKLTKDVYLKPN